MARDIEKLKAKAQRAGDYEKFNSADRWWSKLLASINTWLNPDHAWFDYGSEDFEGTFDNLTNKYLENGLTDREREANAFSAEEAQKSRDFTEYMARNKYSIETQSMQDAGVNPAMVYGGGSLVPTASNGAQASSVAPSGGLSDILPQLMALVRMPLEMQKLQADVEQTNADTARTQVETEGMTLQNEITQGTKDAIIELTNMEPEEKRATIDKIVQETKSEDIRTQILGVQLLQSKLDYDQNKRMNDLIFEMQQMQNNYQKFVNDHQEAQWLKDYEKTCAEINDLWMSAQKKMSDIEVNNADIALKNAQAGRERAQTGFINQQTQTEKFRTTHEAVSTWKDYNDPKAHLVRSVVDPMDKLHNILKIGQNFGKNFKNGGYERFSASGKVSKDSDRAIIKLAEGLEEMYSTMGQAYEEYGSIE